MAVFNGVFPIVPGKEQGGRDFAARAWGSAARVSKLRRPDRDLPGNLRALQETPMGSFMVVWFEAPDIEKAFTDTGHRRQRVQHLVPWPSQRCDWRRHELLPESPLPDVLVDWTP